MAAAGATHGQGWGGAQAGSGVQEGFKHPPHFPNQLPPGVPSLFDVHLNPAKASVTLEVLWADWMLLGA